LLHPTYASATQLASSRDSNAILGKGFPPSLSILYVFKLRRPRYVWRNSQKRHLLRILLRASQSTPVCSRWLHARARQTRVDPHLRLKEQYHSRAAALHSRFPPDLAHSFGHAFLLGAGNPSVSYLTLAMGAGLYSGVPVWLSLCARNSALSTSICTATIPF
jgi:hypothetical protein